MQKGFKTLVAEANQQIVTYTVPEAMAYLNQESELTFVRRAVPPEGAEPRAQKTAMKISASLQNKAGEAVTKRCS